MSLNSNIVDKISLSEIPHCPFALLRFQRSLFFQAGWVWRKASKEARTHNNKEVGYFPLFRSNLCFHVEGVDFLDLCSFPCHYSLSPLLTSSSKHHNRKVVQQSQLPLSPNPHEIGARGRIFANIDIDLFQGTRHIHLEVQVALKNCRYITTLCGNHIFPFFILWFAVEVLSALIWQ